MRKITIITGASSGIGAEFARQLSKKYNDEKINDREIWLIARSEENLNKIKEERETLDTNKVFSVKTCPLDLSGEEGCRKYHDLLLREKAAGDLNIEMLINNAGFGTYGPFEQTPVEKETAMVELNCTSLTGVTGWSIEHLTAGSTIINTASLAAFMPLGNFAVYAASKSYVLSFTVALASELKGRGIKVTALCPGSVSTEFANVASKGARKEVLHGKSCEKTVRDALAKSRRGKMISMWALKWKMNSVLCGIFPKTFIAWATYRFGKRPSN